MPALPTRPSLRHLKNEAKDLHKALKAGGSEAVARVRQHLPSLDRGEKPAEEISLQEVQHAVAQEYGFRTWADLQHTLELDFNSLILLSDQDAWFILQETDHKDLVIALKQPESEAERAVGDHLLKQTTQRIRTFMGEEMEFLGPMPRSDIEDAQQRILNHVCQLGGAGRIAWPLGGEGDPNAPLLPPEMPPELDLVRRPLEELTTDEVRTICRGLCTLARQSGIPALEAVADEMEALEPRAAEITRAADLRYRLIAEGIVAIQRGLDQAGLDQVLDAVEEEARQAAMGGGVLPEAP